jgi:hypothetical protein
MDKFTPARKSARRPTYLSGDLLVELACSLILVRICLKPGVIVFCAMSLSYRQLHL